MNSSFHSRGQANGGPNPYGSNNRHGPGANRHDLPNGDQRSRGPALSSAPSAPYIHTGNIMNRKAPPDSSLFQICLNLRRRLATVPGFDEHLAEMEEEEQEANEATDPVTTMWNCLRRGFPLLTIYNAFRPAVLLTVDSNISESKVTKHAAFKFLQACMSNLKFPASEMFLITDLYGENTTGFVKVTKVVNRVLDLLQREGRLMESRRTTTDSDSSRPQTQTTRQRIINELVETERDYINHLENLQQFKKELEQNGVLPGDVIHDIFLNLDGLLEFQRRFQVRLEQQYSSEESTQQWGKLFSHYAEPFKVYVPFIANQTTCTRIISREWDKLRNAPISPELHGIVETQSVLLGFISKPFQRLTKYPMLLQELAKKGGYEAERTKDLTDGATKINDILHESNDAIAREARRTAVEELQQRVEDWKGHKIDHFGELLLNGTYTVLKGEGAKEVEREYRVYLFERILLCCKEINPNKPKNKMLGNNRPLVDKKGKPKLQLKGRIFMQNVTDVLTLSHSNRSSFTVQIFWKGDPGVENFVIRFPDETTMVNWRETVQSQKKRLSESRSSGQTTSSATSFPWMTNQPAPVNPYHDDEDQDEDESMSSSMSKSTFPVSRNASNSSLRSFPGPNIPLGVPPPNLRLPISSHTNGAFGPSLSLNTNVAPGAGSPGEFAGASYFSPTNESPISTRVSSQASLYAFPRQSTPGGGYGSNSNKHHTTPAMPRAPSREGYNKPALPVGGHSQGHPQGPTSAPQSRLRSASTPDITNGNDPRSRRQPNGPLSPPLENVPVPPIPPGMRSPSRSQTGSPNTTHLPIRTANAGANFDPPSYRLNSNAEKQSIKPTADAYLHSQIQANGIRTDVSQNSSHDDSDLQPPAQIKVKILYDRANHYLTIVVGNNIKYRVLIDRIDQKMQKITSSAISKGSAKLIYEDAEGDLISIQSDDDVALALEDWLTRNEKQVREKTGFLDDFELIWQEKPST